MEPLKNLLGIQAAKQIAQALKRGFPDVSIQLFLQDLEQELQNLELKERMLFLKSRIAQQIEPHPKSFNALTKSLKQSSEDNLGLSGFLVWPLTQFVAEYGLDDFPRSLKALKKMTRVFTAEFAVRPFFIKDQSYMLKQFMEWSQDPDEHVRRLVSEGSRPLLPWGQKLPQFSENPELTWPLLLALKNDISKYVQKSVANHMNDLSKNNGDWLVQNLKNWPNQWVVKHATRTLIKKGHSGALQLSGVSAVQPQIVKISLNTKKIKLGDRLKGSLVLKNPTKKNMTVVVDVCLDLLKSNGKYSKKVFKGKRILLLPNSQLKTILNTPLKKVTTRVYYKGHQYWSLMINGQNSPPQKFTLDLKTQVDTN